MLSDLKNSKIKDPYLKPVILGGLVITGLSLVFSIGIFLWAIVGGYITVRLANKITEKAVSIGDGLLLGLFSGVVGGSLLNVITVIAFQSPENQRLLINTLEKNWPKEMHPIPHFKELLPSLFITVCIFIIIISILFALIGACIGSMISRNTKKIGNE